MIIKSKTSLPAGTLVLGVVAFFVGMAMVVAYFLDAVIAGWGKPDQSLLFWYLPILFIGIAAVVVGLVAILWGLRHLRKGAAVDNLRDNGV